MAALKMEWTQSSKSQFEGLKQRAVSTGHHDHFKKTHNQIVAALQDLTLASEKGEMLRFISVCYVLFRNQQVGWILNYQPVPASWPE